MRLRRPSTSSAIALTALVIATSTGSAFAARHYLITSTKQIKPGVLKSLRGDAGPQGSQGPSGPVGQTGPAGPSNLSGLTINAGEKVPIPANKVATSIATCPTGSHVVSGGGSAIDPDGMDVSQMSEDHLSWFVIATNLSSTAGETVQAYAYCSGAGDAVAARSPSAAHARAAGQASALVLELDEVLRTRQGSQPQ